MDLSESDFQTLYTAFHPKILRYVTRLVGEAEAEDVTQEVFVKLSQALGTFRGQAQVSTWIYRIATNAAIDKARSPSFRQGAGQCELEDLDETGAAEAFTGKALPSLEQLRMHQEMIECFLGFLDRLPLDYRTVFALSDLEELSNSEIADILGVSVETVKIRLHRGRARLIQELKAHCKAEDWL
jgi:RNA polymerase sigma-70 factor (ECF subfamily)